MRCRRLCLELYRLPFQFFTRHGADRSKAAAIAAGAVRGTDIDREAVELLNQTIGQWLNDHGATAGRVTVATVRDPLIEPVSESFDVIVGNPPWGQKRFRFSLEQKRYVREHYHLGKGVLDPCKLFVELALRRLRPDGRWGYVLPDTVLLKNYEPLREHLLDESTVLDIAHVGEIFPDANIDSVIITGRKSLEPADHQVNIWHGLPKNDTPDLRQPTSLYRAQPQTRFNIYLDKRRQQFVTHLGDKPRLGDFFEIREGVHTGNIRGKLICTSKPSTQSAKILMGRKELVRGKIAWHGKWIDLSYNVDKSSGEYAQIGPPSRFRPGKILVRRTGDKLIAGLDRQGYYVSNNMFVLLPKQDMHETTLGQVVALLNSDFMTCYFRIVQPRVGRLFAELKINHLKTFPMPCAPVQLESQHACSEAAVHELYGLPANMSNLVEDICC